MEINILIYFVFVMVALGVVLDAFEAGVDWRLLLEHEDSEPPYLLIFLLTVLIVFLIIAGMWHLI